MSKLNCSLLSMLFLLCSSQIVNAQLVLTESLLTDRFGTIEDVISYETENPAGLQAIVNASGENQTWDFSSVIFTDTTELLQSYLTLPADLPGSDIPELSAADFVEYGMAVEEMDTVQILLYQSLDNGNLRSHGLVFSGTVEGQTDTLVTLYSPPALDGVLPAEFGQNYTDSTSLKIDDEPVQTYTLSEVTADGWGTLVFGDLSVPALRFFNREMTYLIAGDILFSEFHSVDFITADGIFADIELDDQMQPLSASLSIGEPQTSTAIESDELPAVFRLDQNHPNPFNPSTQISFELFENSRTTLQIYSLDGKLLDTLIDGPLAAGSYQVPFNAGNLASGVYLYKLEAGASSKTRIMTLVK